MSEMQAVNVNIMDRDFKVACSEDEREGLITAVNYLDRKMREIRDSGKVVGSERIAIMAALNIAHELMTTRSGGFDIGDFKRRITFMQEQIDEAMADQNKLF